MTDEQPADPWAAFPDKPSNTPKPGGEGDPWAAFPDKPAPKPADAVDERQYHAPLATTALASMTNDPKEKVQVYAKAFGQPVTDFTVSGDRIMRKIPAGQPKAGTFADVKENEILAGKGVGDTAGRLAERFAGYAGPAIPAIAGGAGALLGGAAGLAGSPVGALAAGTAGGSAGAAAGEMAKQGAFRHLSGIEDAQPDWASVGEEAKAGSLYDVGGKFIGAGVGAAGRGLKWLAAKIPGIRNYVGDLPDNPLKLPPAALNEIHEDLKGQWNDIEEKAAAAREYGYNLDLGQITGNPTIQGLIRYLKGTPEGSTKIVRADQRQNRVETPNAVRQFLDEFAPEPEAPIAGFRAGAEAVKKDVLDQRGKEANAAFGKALDERTDRYWNDDLDALFKRPSMQAGLANARKIAAEEGYDRLTVPAYENGKFVGRETVPDWRSWQYIKQGIDQVLDENTNETTGRLTTYGGKVAATKRKLMGMLTKENPEWGEALAKYGHSSDAVNQILDGGAGWLAKQDGPDRQMMISKIFAGTEHSPTDAEITQLRGLYDKVGATDDWNAALRSYISAQYDKAVGSAGRSGNVAGKFYNMLWQTPGQRRVLEAAIGDPQKLAAFDRFGKLLDAAAEKLPTGSPTQGNQAFEKATSSNMLQSAEDISHLTSPIRMTAKALGAFGDRMQALKIPEERKKLVDFLFDEDGYAKLKSALSIMPMTGRPGSLAAQRQLLLMNRVLAQAGVSTEQRLLPPPQKGTDLP